MVENIPSVYFLYNFHYWGLYIRAERSHFLAGVAGIRYRTLFQKWEFQAVAPRVPSGHLMGALLRIRCCSPEGRCVYPWGPVSPSWIRITLISLWTRAWWSPTWDMMTKRWATFYSHLHRTNSMYLLMFSPKKQCCG